MLYKSVTLSPDMIDEEEGYVEGYGSVFGNIDSDGDIISQGAYAKTLAENGSRVKYCYQHDIFRPLGKFEYLVEDEYGLKFKAQIPMTTLGKDTLILMKSGVITENSVGIMPIQRETRNDGVRVLKEVKLYEVSCVTLAANPMALITDAKGEVSQELIAKRYDNLAKILRKENVSDELGYAIEAEIMKLKAIQLSTLPLKDTEPEVKADVSEIYKYLVQSFKN